MVIFVPDISHHQDDISIQGLRDAGAAALIARVGQGAGRRGDGKTYGTTRDRKWARNMAEAKRLGLPLVAYWYIGNLISAEDNARLCADWIGDRGLPIMLDHEDASGSIAFYRDVLAAFGRRGLRVVLSYIPRWYWQSQGSPSLAGLPGLVNSRYGTASGPPAAIYPGDNAAGWSSYGDNAPILLQFANNAAMAGQPVDCSAFRGTRAQLAALLGGNQEDDMSWDTELTFEAPGSRTRAAGTPQYFETHKAAEAIGDTMFYASDTRRTAERIEAVLATLVAAHTDGDLDQATVLARMETAVREATEKAIGATVLPALREIVHDVLGEDNIDQADAILTRLGDRLRPAA